MTFRYTVRGEIEDEAAIADYLGWLIEEGHTAEVCRLGGARAEIVRIDAAIPMIEVRYAFPSREAFAAYERDHAPRLRAEGVARFGSRIRFARTTGELAAWIDAGAIAPEDRNASAHPRTEGRGAGEPDADT